MPANRWQIGALYPEGGLNNIRWAQPGGVGTQVFPEQTVSPDYFSTKPFSELTGIFSAGCAHYQNAPLIQREFDYDTNQSVALVCCALCGYVQYTIEPFEDALNTVEFPWVTI